MVDILYDFVATYGYWIVLGGALVEGEAVVILSGVFAAEGLMNLYVVMLLAFIGTLISDQSLFYFGRWRGKKFLRKYPSLKPKVRRTMAYLRKNDVVFILANRFIYGLRIIGPIIIGTTGVNTRKFSTYNVLAALIWAIVCPLVGYILAEPALYLLELIHKYQKLALLIVICIAMGVISFMRLKKRYGKAHKKTR